MREGLSELLVCLDYLLCLSHADTHPNHMLLCVSTICLEGLLPSYSLFILCKQSQTCCGAAHFAVFLIQYIHIILVMEWPSILAHPDSCASAVSLASHRRFVISNRFCPNLISFWPSDPHHVLNGSVSAESGRSLLSLRPIPWCLSLSAKSHQQSS